MRTTFATILIAILFSISATAQNSNYKASMDGWEVDLNEAYKKSQATGKPIMANFTGSDWCGWCIKLKKTVFTKKEFMEWAKKNFILLELDYPRRTQIPAKFKQQNAQLQQAFKISGYPTVWVFEMTKDETTGNVNLNGLARTGYKGTVKEFVNDVETQMKASKKQ